jgi:L-cystine uptake protein TcyP (sodium:dicarboxylate symporter family)
MPPGATHDVDKVIAVGTCGLGVGGRGARKGTIAVLAAGEFPMALIAVTVTVYTVPLVRLEKEQDP